MAAKQPPSQSCFATLTLLLLFLFVFGELFPRVRSQAMQNAGSAQKDTHGLFNVYFIPAYRVATNRTLKAPPSNAAIVFRPGLLAPRPKSTTTEKPTKLSGAASDVHPEQNSPPQSALHQQQTAFPINSQAAAITQYLLGFRNVYQQPKGYQQTGYQQPNGYQQTGYQQPNGYQHPNGYLQYNRYQQPTAQQQQQYTPIPPGYFPFPTSSNPQNIQGYYPFPPVYIPPSILPKSATEPPALPPVNLNTGKYRASASMKDESVIKSAQISVTPTLATAGPVYATAADEIQTTIEPAPNSTVPEATVTASEETSTNASIKSTTPKTSDAPTSASTSPASDSKTSPASAATARTSQSPNTKTHTPESSSTEKAKAEEHRSISRHFEFSEDKEHSQVNATGDIRLSASRKTSTEGETSQKTPNASAAQGVNPAFPTFPSLPLNTPYPHSHPHPAIIQGPNGFFVGSYNPTNHVGAVPPPSNDPYAYGPFGHPTGLTQGAYPIHPTLPNRYEDLYYGFAPGFPFGVPPSNNATSAPQLNNLVHPRPAPQQAVQPPNQPIPAYNPRQFFDVAAGSRPYPLPQQVPYTGYPAQPFQSPGDYSRFSNEVLQPPAGRPFYAGDPSLTNRGYVPDTGSSGLPNRLYGGDPSGPSAPSRLFNPDPGTDPLLNRGFGGIPPSFITPGFSRSDSAEANSDLTNFRSPVRGVGTAYEIKPGTEDTEENFNRRNSRRYSDEADGAREQVVY